MIEVCDHKFKLKEEISSFAFTNIRIYKCDCGEVKKKYKTPADKKYMEEEEFFKKYGKY